MLDAVDLGHLQKYRAHVERMAERYGVKVWSVICQADVRCRLEHMERLKRKLKADHDQAVAAGKTTEYDEKRPWNLVWAKAVEDEAFWREEVTEPCMLILTKITSTTEVLEGDAKVASAPASSSGAREVAPAPARMTTDRQVRPRNTNRTGRVHNIQDGKYTHNRTGYAICAGYNNGQCSNSTQGVWCAQQWDTVHQCDRCLGAHPSSRCPHTELQTPGFAVGEEITVPSSSQSSVNSVDDVAITDDNSVRILYLFSGPHRPNDGLAYFAKELGADCMYVDKEFDNEHDLLDQSFWEDLKKNFGSFDSTLLPARSGRGGPRPLRGIAGRDRYGLRGLTPSEKKTVTEGTVLAVRASDAAECFHEDGGWWILEQPHEREGQTSMWKLDEMQRLRDKEDVRLYTFAQCRYGCRAEKGTEELAEDQGSQNSLRDVHRWVTDKAKYIGIQVKNLVYRKFDSNQDIEKSILESLGHRSNEDILEADWMAELRREVAELLVRNRLPHMAPHCDVNSTDNEDYKTTIRGKLLHYWSEVVQDPGHKCARWTYEGAPAGLELDTNDLDGLFQRVEPEDAEALEGLVTDHDEFQNYDGVETDDEAFDTLEGYHQKGFLHKFSKLEDVKKYVGGDPVLSKLGCIKKAKLNMDTGETNYKTRIILDCKRSMISKVARRTHKAVLPGVSDAVHSILLSMSSGQSVTLLVADVTDAFWLIPLHVKERKFFVAKLRGQYYVFTRTAQGSRGAPLTFAAVLSVASRWVASSEHTMKLQVYVDDPLAILQGSAAEQRRTACLVIAMWSVMGFPIATHKAVLSQSLVWIGVRLQVEDRRVIAEVPASKVAELDMLLADAVKSNVISKKSLRTLIGKAMHAEQTHAPAGCVWTKQITHSVSWLRTFLSGEKAGIINVYSLDVFNNKGPEVIITWDASPYGMGGTLQIQDTYAEFFAIAISEDDQIHLSTKAGTHEGQQTWEALCGLICLRLWRRMWQTSRVKLRLRNDNMGALTLYAQVKGRSSAHSLLAREFALDLGQAQYKPSIAEHLPGVVNTVCDVLSRRYQPGFEFQVPIQLTKARAVVPPARPKSWWKTLSWVEESPAQPCAQHMGDSTQPPPAEHPKRRRTA
eukprot:s25_g48.t1